MSAKNSILRFRCSLKLKALLEQVATEQELTISEVIRAACEDYCSPPTLSPFVLPVVGEISEKGIAWKSSEVKL